MDKKEQAQVMYEEGVKYKDISEQLQVPLNTLKSWKKRYNWQREVATKRVQPSNRGAPQGNQNAVGNKGNKSASPPKRNSNALKHGLYAKYLPSETYELAEAFDTEDPADLLWGQITTTHALILQTHKIMYVTDNEDHSKEVSGWSSGKGGSSETYAFQYAWDKHANYINTITRATSTLSNLIKQFVSLADEQDERRRKLDLMDAQIAKLKATTPEVGDSDDEPIIIVDSWGDDE